MKKILEFLSEHYQFLVVKFSVYLKRNVFVMKSAIIEWACFRNDELKWGHILRSNKQMRKGKSYIA